MEVAMRQRRLRRRAFTMVELLVVIAVVLLLVALFTPTISTRRPAAVWAACRSNLKQISLAVRMYTEDYDRMLPPAENAQGGLPLLLHPYLRQNGQVWWCPEDSRESAFNESPKDASVSYGFNWLALSPNGKGVPLAAVRKPEETVLFAESSSYRATPRALLFQGGTALVYRHRLKEPRRRVMDVAWLDGHVTWIPPNHLEEQGVLEGGRIPGPGIDSYRWWNLR
jgi:prepilin-type N-terminal cleavage/methylation domain-containing protein/prepilin-type processing-associated H-X9-DG protein